MLLLFFQRFSHHAALDGRTGVARILNGEGNVMRAGGKDRGPQAVFVADGGLGDDDLTVNGTVVDPGGLAIGDPGIPTLSEWMLLVLTLLLASTGAYATANRSCPARRIPASSSAHGVRLHPLGAVLER